MFVKVTVNISIFYVISIFYKHFHIHFSIFNRKSVITIQIWIDLPRPTHRIRGLVPGAVLPTLGVAAPEHQPRLLLARPAVATLVRSCIIFKFLIFFRVNALFLQNISTHCCQWFQGSRPYQHPFLFFLANILLNLNGNAIHQNILYHRYNMNFQPCYITHM